MRKFLLALGMALAGVLPAKAACSTGGAPLFLQIPNFSDAGNVWATCLQNDLILLSTTNITNAGPVTFTSSVTMQNNAFSIGGGTLVVKGGLVGINTGTLPLVTTLEVSGTLHVGQQSSKQAEITSGFTAAAPAYSFWADTGSGMYQPGTGVIGWSIEGTEGMHLNSTGLVMDSNQSIALSGSSGYITSGSSITASYLGGFAGGIYGITESQVVGLTTDLGNKLSASGPATFTGNLTITASGSGVNGLTVGNGGGISAYTITLTTGIVTGGAGSVISGNLTVGSNSFPGNIYALGSGAGLLEVNDIAIFDASSPKSSSTIESTGGAQFGCSTPGSGCVQTIGSDGRIPALTSTYFQNLNGSALTNVTGTDSSKVPLAGGTMTGTLQMSNGLGSANVAGNIVFSDQFYHTLQFKQTSGPQGWPNGAIQFVQGGTGMHRIISFDNQDTAAQAFAGALVIGGDPSGASGNAGVVINGASNVHADLFISTYGWTAIGSTTPATNGGNYGLWVGGNIVSTGTLKIAGTGVSTFAGSLTVAPTSGSGGVVINAADSSDITLDIDGTSSFRGLYVRGSSANNNILGKLGINMSGAPSAPLDVGGSNAMFATENIRVLDDGTNSYFEGGYTRGTGYTSIRGSGGQDAIVIDGSGRVGVNKTNPSYALDIAGTVAYGGSGSVSEIAGRGTTTVIASGSTTTFVLSGTGYTTGLVIFYNNNTGGGCVLGVGNSNVTVIYDTNGSVCTTTPSNNHIYFSYNGSNSTLSIGNTNYTSGVTAVVTSITSQP